MGAEQMYGVCSFGSSTGGQADELQHQNKITSKSWNNKECKILLIIQLYEHRLWSYPNKYKKFAGWKVKEDYLNFAGEKTPTQSSTDGLEDSIFTVTHSVSSPCDQE